MSNRVRRGVSHLCARLVCAGIVALGAGLEPPSALGEGPAEPVASAPATQAVQSECGDGHFRLDGASAGAEEGADFSADWAPKLDQIAACGRLLALTTSCLEIRGHYDAVEFRGAQAVVGGMARAQRLRAESRASRVADELRRRGVADAVLRHNLPPLDFPTFRGTSIDLSPHCRDGVVEQYALAIASELRRDSERPAPVESKPAPSVPEPVSEPAEPSPAPAPEATPAHAPATARRTYTLGVFTTPGLHFALYPGADGSPALGADLDAGGLLRVGAIYGTGRVGAAVGLPREDRLSLFGGLSVGYSLEEWLQLGLALGLRSQASKFGGPVLDTSVGIGLEALERVGTLGPFTLYAWQQLSGLHRTRQGEITNDKITRIPETSDLGAELNAGLRFYYGVVQ